MKRIALTIAAVALVLNGCATPLSKNDKTVLAGAVAVAVGAGAAVALSAKGQHDAHESHKVPTCGTVVHPVGNLTAGDWYIGPTLWDGNHSPGMPLHPEAGPGGVGFVITFPTAPGQKVDYVTANLGSLTGKSEIDIDYELTEDPGVQINAVPEPDKGDTSDPTGYRARMTTHFQQIGDDWSAGGIYEPMRWYFDTGPDMHYLEPGAHTIIASLAGPGWGATQTSTFENNPAGYHAAIDHTQCVGIVFGGNGIGIGHGANATGLARMWVKRFEVR